MKRLPMRDEIDATDRVPRAILDANVLVSAFIGRRRQDIDPSPPVALLDRRLRGEFVLVLCPTLVDEVMETLISPKLLRYAPQDSIPAFRSLIETAAESWPDPATIPSAARDPDDDYLIALAIETGAMLVTGDANLREDASDIVETLGPREWRPRPASFAA